MCILAPRPSQWTILGIYMYTNPCIHTSVFLSFCIYLLNKRKFVLILQPPGRLNYHINYSNWKPWKMKFSRFPAPITPDSKWRMCVMFPDSLETSVSPWSLLFYLLTYKSGITMPALSRSPGGFRDLIKVFVLSHLLSVSFSVVLHS